MALPQLRPPISRQHSRVPGGFDTDDDLSPVKISFEGGFPVSSVAEEELERKQNDTHVPSEDGRSQIQGNDSIVDEKEMGRRLLDVESSFLPEGSPVNPAKSSASNGNLHTGLLEHESDGHNLDQDKTEPPGTPPGYFPTMAPGREELPPISNFRGEISDHANTSSLETMSSSPTAAAAARTVSRVVSMASIGGYETAEEEKSSIYATGINDKVGNQEHTPKSHLLPSHSLSRAGSPTPTKQVLDGETEDAANADIDEEEPKTLQNPKKRPKFLNSRFASQRSSYSSYTSQTTTSTEGASDLTVGAEYALQTGGATPFSSSTLSGLQPELSRSTSLGSMASGISTLSDGDERPRTVGQNLDSLAEESGSILDQGSKTGEGSLPRTPRATSRLSKISANTMIDPNGTLSRPGTARGQLDRYSGSSPERRITLPTPATARGKNLTLKEQSSTIDKLQKENWDLKLKIQFMSNLINQRSEEGVNSIMSENVELRTDKYKAAQEIRKQKRLVRELEFKLKEIEEARLSRARGHKEEETATTTGEHIVELETQVTYLRERAETFELEVEQLRQQGIVKDGEKRRLAEAVKSLSERRSSASDIGAREEVDMWKDLLDTETARREQADEDNRKMREELWRMKSDAASAASYNHPNTGVHTGTRQQLSSGTDQAKESLYETERPSTASSTLVEQLRHENAELRREVGAQTSMLTSRNREKERLYQEIEDLKIGQRRGDGSRSVTGDSIFERSASRAHGRAASRASDDTRNTQVSDVEREHYELQIGELRDQISELKLQNQQFAKEIEGVLDEIDHLKHETDQELLTMQKERDEALTSCEELDSRFNGLKEEAQERLDACEDELDQKVEQLEQLEAELASRDDESSKLQNEVRMLSEGLNRVDAEVQTKVRRIQEVELENEDINRELENLEKSLLEANGKTEKLFVELESRQGECAFLREEQDVCMLKIGDLETAIKAAHTNLNSEKDRNNDLEARLKEERHQREVIGTQEKQDVQKMMNELNRELSSARDELRKLKRTLENREVELTSWKEKHNDIETGLRNVLGDASGSKSSFFTTISKLQKDLEATSANLESTRHSLSEKERLLQRRDALLESHGLESRKLSELLDKERAGRRADKVQHEQWQKTHEHTSRTVHQKDSRIVELESSRQIDRKKLTTMEQQYKEQMLERNNLLLAIWHRLASICGSDWQHQNSLVSGHLPTIEVVSGMLPGFTKNLMAALKNVESLITGFRSRIRGIERDLMKDFQALEHNLDMRIKRLDRLESAVEVSRVSGAVSAAPEIAKLRGENRMLKAELVVLQKQDMHSRASRSDAKVETADRSVQNARGSAMPAGLIRHHSSSAVEVRGDRTTSAPPIQSQPIEPSQQRWIHRLRELERRLKAEREARLLDRSGARKRLEEERAGAEELRQALEREKVRRGQ